MSKQCKKQEFPEHKIACGLPTGGILGVLAVANKSSEAISSMFFGQKEELTSTITAVFLAKFEMIFPQELWYQGEKRLNKIFFFLLKIPTWTISCRQLKQYLHTWSPSQNPKNSNQSIYKRLQALSGVQELMKYNVMRLRFAWFENPSLGNMHYCDNRSCLCSSGWQLSRKTSHHRHK